MPSFACPKCRKVLKTTTPIPAGKNVKCPGCGHVFPMAAVSDDAHAVQVDKPVSRSPKAAAVSGPPRRRDEPEDDYDDEEDRPAPRRKKKKGGSKVGLILALGGGGVLLLILGIAGFVWPGFLVKGGKAGPVDLFAVLPNNCDVVFGATKPGQVQWFAKVLRQAKDVNLEAIELFNGADRIVGGAVGEGEVHVVGFTSLAPLDPEKVRRALGAGPPMNVKGRVLHKVVNAKTGETELMAMPNDKTVVVGSLPEAEFVKLLEARGKISADLRSQANALQHKPVWVVGSLQGALKDKVQAIDFLGFIIPEAAQSLIAVKSGKTLSFSMDASKDATVQVDLQCKDEQDAVVVESQGKSLWEQKGKALLAGLGNNPLLAIMPGAQGAAAMVVADITNTCKIQRQGPQVSVTVTLSENTLKSLENLQPPR
jgi:hypothetical protein